MKHVKLFEQFINEAEYKVGDTITVTLKGGKEVVKGKVEKLNPLKVRTGPTDVQVLGNHLIKNVVKESVVNEAEIKSDEEFKEYAFTVLKKAFGDDFDEAKAQEVVDGILSKSDGDYGAAVGMLTSSLG